MNTLLVKIIASFLAALFSLFNISVDIPGFSDENISSTTIEYLNETPGSMNAVIDIKTTTDGTYKLYWADETFEKLTFTLGEEEIGYSEFAEITTYFGEGSLDLPDYTAIPDGASNILVTRDGEVLEIYEIPAEKRTVSEEKISAAVSKVFDLRPAAIIEMLELRRPIYQPLSAYGHLGREDLNVVWEKTDKAEALKTAVAEL